MAPRHQRFAALASGAGLLLCLLASIAPGDLDLEAEAALIRFLWKVAPMVTLAHDVGSGGLAAAVEEAAEWSGRAAEVELPAEPVGTAAILACAPEDVDELGSRGLVRIGEVG